MSAVFRVPLAPSWKVRPNCPCILAQSGEYLRQVVRLFNNLIIINAQIFVSFMVYQHNVGLYSGDDTLRSVKCKNTSAMKCALLIVWTIIDCLHYGDGWNQQRMQWSYSNWEPWVFCFVLLFYFSLGGVFRDLKQVLKMSDLKLRALLVN